MNIKSALSLGVIAAALAACDSGDVNLTPTNVDNSVDNSVNGGGGSNNPCVSYEVSGQTFQGDFDGDNCTYAATFVSDTKPLSVDLSIPALTNGIHIFEDSLWVGEDVNAAAAAQGVRIPQDGEGPTLTIAAGAQIAFTNSQDYIRIARGSRIFAEGTATNPIIFSAVDDLVNGVATEADRGLWGGIQINGNGFTNKCSMANNDPFDPNNLSGDFAPTTDNPHNCHVTAEGRPATYGGVNNAENSGTLRYVQIRHAGFEVVDGDELNALTLNGVGSGTTIEFVQVYTSQDDGFEMFGGAVSMKNIVAVNVGDDSIDYSEGYVGNIQYALVVHTSGANRCIEGDNTGDTRADDIGPYTKLRIANMTCVTTNVDEGNGTEPSSKGDSEGPLFREGVYFEMYNSIVTSSEAVMASNECLEIDNAQAIAGAETDGFSVAAGNIVACTEDLKHDGATFDMDAWFAADNVAINDPLNLPAQVIAGLDTNPRAYVTASTLQDANAAPIAIAIYDVTQLDDSFEAQAVPAVGSTGDSSFFEMTTFVGAVDGSDDWVAGWTTGL